MLDQVEKIVNEKRVPKQEVERFQKAQQERDFTTMWDVLFHSACQLIKKRQGKFWDIEKIIDTANDMVLAIMDRYRRKPDYHVKSHITCLHFCYMGIVGTDMKKQEEEQRRTVSYEALYGSNS